MYTLDASRFLALALFVHHSTTGMCIYSLGARFIGVVNKAVLFASVATKKTSFNVRPHSKKR